MVDEAQPGRELPPPTGEPVSLSEPGSGPDVTPQPPTQPHVPRHRRAPSWRRWALDLAVVFVTSSVLTAWIFRVWDRPLRIPFNYSGDGLTQTSVVKGIIETGWYTFNPRVGAPTGFNSYDFPLGGDNLHYLVVKVLSWFSHDAFLVTNLTYLAGFVLVALSAFVALRLLGVRRLLAHPFALVFTFLPYHFLRGTAHMTLAAYLSVPLAVLLIVKVAGDRPPFFSGDRRRRWARGTGFVSACAVIGSANAYYAVFALCLLGVAALAGALARGSWRPLLAGAACGALIVGTLLVNSWPALRYQGDNGKNPGAAARQVYEVDYWPLRPVQLVTPVPGHRLAVLDRISSDLRQGVQSSEPTQYLGSLGTIGLVIALGSFAVAALRRRDTVMVLPSSADDAVGDAPPLLTPTAKAASSRVPGPEGVFGLVIVAALVIGVAGGFSWFVSLAGLREVRAWGRISVFVAFASLVSLALAVQWVTKRWKPPLVAIAGVVLVAVAIWDQVPQWIVSDPRVNREQFFIDQQFIRQIENTLPAGSMVFQLPRAAYPEDPQQFNMPADNQLRPYLQSRTLKWSFGGMRGRESDWQIDAVSQPMPKFLDTISAIGFSGIVVDRFGYGDNGDDVNGQLIDIVGQPRYISEDGRLVFYDLRSYRVELQGRVGDDGMQKIAVAELGRPTMWWDDGFYFEERTADGSDHPAENVATSEIVNYGTDRWSGILRFDARSAGGESGTLTVEVDGAAPKTVALTGRVAIVEITLDIPVGRTAVRWSSDIPPRIAPGDPRSVSVVVSSVQFVDD